MPNAPKRIYPAGVKPGYTGNHTIHPHGTFYYRHHRVAFQRHAKDGKVVVSVVGFGLSAESPAKRYRTGQVLTIKREDLKKEWRPKPARQPRPVGLPLKGGLLGALGLR